MVGRVDGWSGRALQVDFAKLAVGGLASMYPVSDWSCFAPDHHGYQRACVLINGQASTGHVGHQCSQAPGRPNLHLVSSSRRPRQVRVINPATSSRIPHLTFTDSTIKQVGRWRSTSPRSPDHRSSNAGDAADHAAGSRLACLVQRSLLRCEFFA